MVFIDHLLLEYMGDLMVPILWLCLVVTRTT